MKTQNQTKELLKFLKKHKSINPIQAMSNLKIYRLSARIFDLREQGIKIKTKRMEENGMAKYTLGK